MSTLSDTQQKNTDVIHLSKFKVLYVANKNWKYKLHKTENVFEGMEDIV